MNLTILFGNIGKQPEIKATGEGRTMAKFSMATKGYKDSVDWHNCLAFNETAELIEKYVNKGDKLGVQGRLQTRKWTDKDGNDRYTTEVIVDRIEFAGGKSEKPAESNDDAVQAAKEDVFDAPF